VRLRRPIAKSIMYSIVLSVWLVLFGLWTSSFLQSPKYSPSLPPKSQPIFQFYDDLDLQPQSQQEPDCRVQQCSWLHYIGNQPFDEANPENPVLYEGADLALKSSVPSNEPKLTCLPEKFGYTHEEADKLFPLVGYQTCLELGFPTGLLKVDIHTNSLTLNCPGGNGTYWVGCKSSDELLGIIPSRATKHPYTGPVSIPSDVEYFFATCQLKVEAATYQHRAKPEVVARVRADMKASQAKVKESVGESVTRPLTVLVLTLDSLSRRQFYRKLPRTVEFLNSVKAKDFRVFDFLVHNVIGDNSFPNAYPIWSGETTARVPPYLPLHAKSRTEDILGEAAIWSYMKRNVKSM
jgi:hypothetical protein